MSTAPKAEDFEKTLQQLFSISQAILDCEASDMDTLQKLMDEREPLLAWLHEADPSLFSAADSQAMHCWIERIQATDRAIALKFQEILSSQSATLHKISKARQALSHYKFPSTAPSTGVENQG